jgi:dolichyl-phosphate beta-glucosyltransferase
VRVAPVDTLGDLSATPSLSIVVPVYNEEHQIAGSLERLRDWLRDRGGEWEILVVDNASTDATVAIAGAAGEGVEVLVNDQNRGKGYSVRRGMLAATGDLRLFCDADCWRSLPSLQAMLDAAEDYDIVIGSRLAPGAQVERPQTPQRRIVGPLFLKLTKALMREPAADIYCGFKLWRAEVTEEVFSRATIDGWAFDAEVLALARRLGYSATEQGIVWINGEQSRLSIGRTIVPAVRDLLRARAAARRMPRRAPRGARVSPARTP